MGFSLFNLFSAPAPQEQNDAPFRSRTPEYEEYRPPVPNTGISGFFSSFFSKAPEPEYIRITQYQTTPEQEALLARADALYTKHLERSKNETRSQKMKTISQKKLAILNQCIYLLTESTWGSRAALITEKETQLKKPDNYTYNDAWSAYLGARNDTVILVEEVIKWANDNTLHSDPPEFEIQSPGTLTAPN